MTFGQTLRLRAGHDPFSNGYKFLLLAQEYNGKQHYGKSVTMVPYDQATYVEPTFTLDEDMARALMDELWNLGLRPSNGEGSAGQLRATEKHLDDMRQLVFFHLGVSKP